MRCFHTLLFALIPCMASASRKGKSLPKVAGGISLMEAYGEVDEVDHMQSWANRRTNKSVPLNSTSYYASRSKGRCDFPLEVMIVQDATGSFEDDYTNMKDKQLDLMFDGLVEWHPTTTFGVASFADIPKWSLGDPNGDYCHRFDQSLTCEHQKIRDAYNRLESAGGADGNEAQFLSIIAAAQSNQSGWQDADATRLIVLVTDAAPHFKDDGFNKPEYNLGEYSGQYDEENPKRQCTSEYYPSPEDVKRALTNRKAYLVQLIFGGDYQGGLVWDNWKWFNSYIGQTEGFLLSIAEDSSNFWDRLSDAVREVDRIECEDEIKEATALTEDSVPASADDESVSATLPCTGDPGKCVIINCKCTDEEECGCPNAVVEVRLKVEVVNPTQ